VRASRRNSMSIFQPYASLLMLLQLLSGSLAAALPPEPRVACGANMTVGYAGCGMDEQVMNIIGSWEDGCTACMKYLIERGTFIGCGGGWCEKPAGGLLSGSPGIWLKAWPAPPPPPRAPPELLDEKRLIYAAAAAAGGTMLLGIFAILSGMGSGMAARAFSQSARSRFAFTNLDESPPLGPAHPEEAYKRLPRPSPLVVPKPKCSVREAREAARKQREAPNGNGPVKQGVDGPDSSSEA